jgi:hypothetical protein
MPGAPIERSIHHCINCGEKVHGALCAHKINETRVSIVAEFLSERAQAYLNNDSALLCYFFHAKTHLSDEARSGSEEEGGTFRLMVEASGMSERNACLAKKADNETHNIIISRRDAAKRKHDEYLAKLRTRITDSKEMNQRIKAVKKHVDENPDSLNSFSYDYDDEEIIDSQEDIIKDLLRSRNTFLHAQKEASQYESKSKL